VPGERDLLSGDLIVNLDRAVQEGPRQKGIDYELALYIAHGLNHLSGADDDTPETRRKMRATETAWLRAAAKEGLLENLVERR
jgi:ssRNA-specific RNase YbeY (16S rRNA maturation enzyme)